MRKRLRNYFLTGSAVVLPLTVTFYILLFIFELLDGWARHIIFAFTGHNVPGIGLLLTLCLLLLVGLLTTNYIGQRFIALWESVLLRIPLVCVIYKTTKQIVEVISGHENRPFRKTVLIQYPRQGLYTIAFVTGEVTVKDEKGDCRNMVCTFVCTTPNPTTGFLVLVPSEEVIYLTNAVEDGIRMVLSGGIVASRDGEKAVVLCHEPQKAENQA